MLRQTLKKGFHSSDKISPFGTPFRKHAIKFLQKFRIDFESSRRNVKSDLQKRVFIVGVELQLFSIWNPFNFRKHSIKFLQNFRIDFQNRLTEILGQTFKKGSS